MAKAKTSPPPPSDEQELLRDAVGELNDKVGVLTDQIEVLRIAIDDLREEVEYAVRNIARPAWAPSPAITSLPKDPLADDFEDRINRFSAKDLPPETGAPVSQGDDDAPPSRHESPAAAQRRENELPRY